MTRLVTVILSCWLLERVNGGSFGLICSKIDCRGVTRALRSSDDTIKVQSFTINNLTPLGLIEEVCDKFIRNDVTAIVFINTNTDIYDRTRVLLYRFLMSLTESLSIPLLGWNPAVTKSLSVQNRNYLQLVPSIDNQCETMFDLLIRYSWKKFVVVTTATDGHKEFVSCLRRKEELNEKSGFHILSIVKILQTDRKLVYEKLSEIPQEARIILMHSNLEEGDVIFEVADELSLTTADYQWIVTKHVIAETEEDTCRNCVFPDGCLGVSYITSSTVKRKKAKQAFDLFIKADRCFSKYRVASKVPKDDISCKNESSHNTRWTAGQLFYECLRNASLTEEDSKVKVEFTEAGMLKESEMNIVNYRKSSQNWNTVGTWNPVNKITLDEIQWPGGAPQPPKDRPKKWKLRIVTLDEEPYVLLTDVDKQTGLCLRESMVRARWEIKPGFKPNPNGTVNPDHYTYKCVSGLAIDLLQRLEKDIGFEYELFRVEDNKWGDNATGEWNGLVRSLMDHKADMCLTSLKINNDRSDAISFSLPFLETGITIIVGIKKGVISPTAFLEPFELLMWLFILLVCITVVSVTVFILEWISPFGYNRKKKPPKEPYDFSAWCLILVFSVHAVGTAIFVFEWLSPRGLDRGNGPRDDDSGDHKFSLFRSFWLIWAMLFGAAVDTDTPKGVASRFMGSIWALFALVFLASYTANLAAFMIAKEDFYRLRGLQDPKLQFPKATKPAFRYGTLNSGNTANVLRNNHERLYRYMRDNNFLLPSKVDAIQMIKEDNLDAFIYDATVLDYMAGKDKDCRLRTVGAWYAMTGYGIGFPKGDAKWLPKFNEQLMKYQKQGILEKLQSYWMSGACKTGQSSKGLETSHPLEIINFTSAYYLLAGGVLLSVLLMLLEHMYFKFMRRKLSKWDKCGCCGLISLSMGKSLTFEQSVMEMIDVQKHFKCKNPLCETQMWKVKHELDIALVRIERLQNRLRELGYKAVPKSPSLKSGSNDIYDKKATGWRSSQQSSQSGNTPDDGKDSEPSPNGTGADGVDSSLLRPPAQFLRTQTPKSKSPNQSRIRFQDEEQNGGGITDDASLIPKKRNLSGKTYRSIPSCVEKGERLEAMESTL